ncbi:MAG: 3-phosphoshikimate 1-carboxyvinyltransferase, partial [Desulfomonilia bacterium]|nr:3-phosphoshikimate 1-carboxyvinyltransferase [Desulfomonilia bacterium]
MKITGEMRMPGDKSISHRAFMLGALAQGATLVRGALDSLDIQSTVHALRSLGASMEKKDRDWCITGGGLREPEAVIDAGNSGTTARLLSGICAGVAGLTVMTGDSSLIKRPMARVIRPLEGMGASFLARQG